MSAFGYWLRNTTALLASATCIAVTAVQAQDGDDVPIDETTRRALAMPVREAPAGETELIPGEPAPPDPMLAAHLAFHATLDVVSPDRERALRLDAARRVAPMDLSWGLGD